MVPMSSIESPPEAALQMERLHRHTLLDLARQVIGKSVEGEPRPKVDPRRYNPVLREPRGTFVTLYRDGNLRGCIGSLEPHRALVEDVAHNAFAAAFTDPRFMPLAAEDLVDISIEIAILSPLHAIEPADELELLEMLEPRVHGLLIEDAGHRATFLPKVWQAIPDKREFLTQLRLKAGLAGDHWSETFRASVYTTLDFSA